ncbi:MAG TPA: methionine adenosyltransferase [Candidatus Brocadiia bacterium]|nr:methionine adenosyltransferase [Candidatus Brocadiia bacterium]
MKKPGSYLFTSESVGMGHPDKLADQISDAVLDAIIAQDKKCRVACETLLTTGVAFVAGEITTDCYVDIPMVARDAIKEVGYVSADMGFDYHTCSVITAIHQQSPDISIGVTAGQGLHKEQGAGDQGMMFGFAINETEELMPMPMVLSHQLMENLADARITGKLPYIWPDGKCQVTVEYKNGKPFRIDTVVLSTQHAPDVSHDRIEKDIIEKIIVPTMPKGMLDKKTVYHVNPTGRFVVGGPMGDTGLTGRKIIVDTYGGMGRHGGGAFSGKDPTKVDRSAAYAARHAAKNLVAAGVAERLELQVCYAIGVADPLAFYVDTFGTGVIADDKIIEIVRKVFDFRPAAIIQRLDLLRPIYMETARHGHFGHNRPEFTWERTDKVDEIKKLAGL